MKTVELHLHGNCYGTNGVKELADQMRQAIDEAEPCPAKDASGEEHGSRNGQALLESEPQRSLIDGLLALAKAIDEQNQLLGQIVAQNADLIASMVEDQEDERRYDLSGKPL